MWNSVCDVATYNHLSSRFSVKCGLLSIYSEMTFPLCVCTCCRFSNDGLFLSQKEKRNQSSLRYFVGSMRAYIECAQSVRQGFLCTLNRANLFVPLNERRFPEIVIVLFLTIQPYWIRIVCSRVSIWTLALHIARCKSDASQNSLQTKKVRIL
jgi:hypothetical protein